MKSHTINCIYDIEPCQLTVSEINDELYGTRLVLAIGEGAVHLNHENAEKLKGILDQFLTEKSCPYREAAKKFFNMP